MYGNYYPPMYQGAVPDMLNGYKQPYQMPQNKSNDMIWVQGEAGAKGYPVAPNNTVVLWDSESSTIYVKTADASGLPTMRVLDFTERTGNVKPNSEEFVTITQFEELKDKVENLLTKYESEE